MSLKILTLSASLMTWTASAGAQPVISAERISDDVKRLSSDAFEGRGVATPAEDKVVDFLSTSFKDAGLEPGGENGGWTQTVKLRKFQVSDPALSLTIKGHTVLLVQGSDITASTRGALGVVNFEAAPLVFAGYGVTASERGWDDFKGIDVRGKIIVVLINDPDFYQPEAQTFNGKAMTYYGRWTYKFEEAARKGAAGVMIIHDSAAASYGWNTVKNSWTTAQFDIVRPDPSAISPKLESWISAEVADKIFTLAGLDLNALKIAARSKDFKPVPMDGVTLSGGYKVAAEEVVSRNIIGQLKGAKRPDETVFYMAHWDHLGTGMPDADGDAIFNGAVDNATGVAALIELARAFKASGKTPDRTVAFIAVTAEESGLLGSEYYASSPIYPLAKTVGGINMDALNVSGRTRNVEVVGSGQSSLEDDLKSLAAGQNRVLTPDDTPEAGYFFRSDHFPLAKRGVPVLYAASGLDMVKGSVAAGRAFDEDYRKNRYHQANDEWSPDWDLSGLAEDVTLYYQLGAKLANSTAWPQWRETSEFKAVRDKTNAARK